MSDVITTINANNAIINNGAVAGVTRTGRYSEHQSGINKGVHVSGVAGATDNGYLDTRFDSYAYYTESHSGNMIGVPAYIQ